MKRNLLTLCLAVLLSTSYYSQCVYTCSNYAVSQITYTTFPSGSTNVTPSFTNPFIFGPSADDGSFGPIPIGFSFDFYCNTYTAIHICSNGFITFDYQPFSWPTQYVHPTQSIPDVADPNGMIAFNMTDLDPGVGGTITYTTVGVSPNRMFIVTYSNVPCFSTPSDVNTGQIVLFETTNMIEIHTATAKPDINQSTAGSTQGIENTTGTLAKYPPGRNQNNTWGSTANNTAYQFGPYTPAPPTSVTGNTTLCEGESAYYQATFMSGSSAYGWSFPSGWNGTSTISSITSTAGVSGNLSVTATYTCGTSQATTLAINVVPAPVVSIISATPNILCSGSTITFSTSGAVTYTLAPGGMNGTPPFTDIASVSTTYTLTGTNASGCVSTNNPTTFITVNQTPVVSVNSGMVCDGESFTMTPSGADTYSFSNLFSTVTPSAGVYSYSVIGKSNSNGCVSLPAISNLTVHALPTVNAASSKSVMCIKEKVTLTASGALSYTWSTSATTSTISVGPNATTAYSVIGIDNNGCANTSTVTVNVKSCVGINEWSNDVSSIDVYPNPNNGSFHLKVNNVSPNCSVEIYNSLGELIYKSFLHDEDTELNIESFGKGFYFVKVKDSAHDKTMKIIKE